MLMRSVHCEFEFKPHASCIVFFFTEELRAREAAGVHREVIVSRARRRCQEGTAKASRLEQLSES